MERREKKDKVYMKGSTMVPWPGSHIPNKQWEVLTCVCCLFHTQSESIAVNYIVHGDVFELTAELHVRHFGVMEMF